MNTQHDRPSTLTPFREWNGVFGVDRGRVTARRPESYMRVICVAYGTRQGSLDAIARS